MQKTAADLSDRPPLTIYRDRLVFQGFGPTPHDYVISLAEMLESGDAHGALLWAMFFQLSNIDQALRLLVEQSQRAEQMVRVAQQIDPVETVRKLMEQLGAPGVERTTTHPQKNGPT